MPSAPGAPVGHQPIGHLPVGHLPVAEVETATMPDVDDGDVTQANAIAAITGAGLQYPSVTYAQSGVVTVGNVISQEPAAGTEHPITDQTSIVVSKEAGAGNYPGSTMIWYREWFYGR